MHFGIDYGSKLAGTTVITYLENEKFIQVSSTKKQDADLLIINVAKTLKPKTIYIDAPLSIPLGFYDKGDDFFYREVDRKLKAMSPMFLGGLTARAMKLKKVLSQEGIVFHEVYPGGLVREEFNLQEYYLKKDKTQITSFISQLKTTDEVPVSVDGVEFQNWHQVDSLLAWLSGYRHLNKRSKTIGNPKEGVIIL